MLARMGKLPALLPAFAAAAAACAPAPERPDEVFARRIAGLDCGLRAAIATRIPRPGSAREPVESGDAIPACTLPTALELADACKGPEGVPIPGSDNPDNPGRPRYAFPDYRVSNARCAFADAARSRASCRFGLALGDAPPAPAAAELTYRFHDLSNEVMHGWYVARWGVERACRGGRTEWDSYR